MDIQENTTVLYGGSVCRVTGTVERDVNGESQRFWVLQPVSDAKTVIYASVDNPHTASRMRPVLTASEIDELIARIPKEEPAWINNDNERREAFREILRGGDRSEVMGLIRTLYLRRQYQLRNGKRLRAQDERCLIEAEAMIHGEIAHVLKIQRDEVAPYIQSRLEELT